MRRRRVVFVTGTRAEFGLMRHTLLRLRDHPRIDLRLVATGMHLSRAHGYTVDTIRRDGWTIDATVPWKGDPAAATGTAIARLAGVYRSLDPDVVLVVGDRVEAFAAASAAHLDGRVVAHVHGGDRALGQFDDALRHAITKLSHLHFAATAASGRRLLKLGEDPFRVHVVGTPGLDDVGDVPRGPRTDGPLVLLHPDSADETRQAKQARQLFGALRRAGVGSGTIILPNNDPGWRGIATAWSSSPWPVLADVPRGEFLRRLATAAFLIGNSSSGIIEAASLGTRVINVGDRQLGRERSANVVDVPWDAGRLTDAIGRVWNGGRPREFAGRNVYGGGDAGDKIAALLAGFQIGRRLRQKLITY